MLQEKKVLAGGTPRILVISPNWIGDAVMAQPLLQLLRAAHPDQPIDVLAPPAVSLAVSYTHLTLPTIYSV